MPTSNNYEKWADIAKGLGIIAVVLGHSGNSQIQNYIYWFHMPLFFLICGYFYKPINDISHYPLLIKKYTSRLLIPYFCFLLVITTIRYVYRFLGDRFDLQWVCQDIGNIVLGGRFIGGWYGPFWFITTLFFTYILFSAILLFIKKDTTRIILIAMLYIISHIESLLSINYRFIIPLNIDVTLISISYFAFGYYSKRILKNIPKPMFLLCALTSAIFYLFNYLGILHFSLDMKNLGYHDVILDLIIPLSIIITIIGLSQLLLNSKISYALSYLGEFSLPIMYLHILPNGILQPILLYGSFVYTLIGLLIPILITHLFLNRFKLTKALFLGKDNLDRIKH